MPIFRVKSAKIYTGQKKFTRAPLVGSWQISGMCTQTYNTQKHTHTTAQGHAQTNTQKHRNFWLRMLTTQYVRPDSSFSVGQLANVMGNDVAKSLVENGAIIFARWSWWWWLWWCWKQPCSEWGNYLEEVEPSPLQSYPFPQDHRPCDPSEDLGSNTRVLHFPALL